MHVYVHMPTYTCVCTCVCHQCPVSFEACQTYRLTGNSVCVCADAALHGLASLFHLPLMQAGGEMG